MARLPDSRFGNFWIRLDTHFFHFWIRLDTLLDTFGYFGYALLDTFWIRLDTFGYVFGYVLDILDTRELWIRFGYVWIFTKKGRVQFFLDTYGYVLDTFWIRFGYSSIVAVRFLRPHIQKFLDTFGYVF